MGRTRKQTADYFPHFPYKGRTLTVLESKWGCEGYTFWFKLLELLCVSEGHCYDCSNSTKMSYLAIMAMTSEETALNILNLLAEMEKIDTKLWSEKKIIWCQSLVDRLAPLYAKRTTSIPKKPLLDGEVREEEEPEPEEAPPKPLEQPRLPKDKSEKKDIKKSEKPPKTAAPKPPEPEKIQYAEFVSMTEAEYQKLVDKYGEEHTTLFIKKLDNAKGAKGYKYKSDYRAILNWVVDDVEKELQKKGGNVNGRPCTDRNSAELPNGFRPSGGFQGNNT